MSEIWILYEEENYAVGKIKLQRDQENNAASAQENSAISTHLGESAKGLMDTIAEFQLKNN